MEKYSPVQKLDFVLIHLSKSTYKQEMAENIEVELNNILPLIEIKSILKKLVKDGYVEHEEIEHDNSPNPVFGQIPITLDAYSITFEDRAFLEINGGYQKDLNLKNDEKTRLDKLDTTQRGNTANMVTLTFWVALGSIIAALNYFYLLYQDLCWCRFVWQK